MCVCISLASSVRASLVTSVAKQSRRDGVYYFPPFFFLSGFLVIYFSRPPAAAAARCYRAETLEQ